MPYWTEALLGTLIGLVLISPFLLERMGILFTKVPEGQIVVAMRGGKAIRYLGNLPDYQVNPRTGEVSSNPGFMPGSGLLKTGFHLMDWAPWTRRLVYRFRWDRMATNKDGIKFLDHRDEEIDSLYHIYQYAVLVDKVITQDNVLVDILIPIMVQIEHAGKALFPKANWLDVTTAYSATIVRDYGGSKKYQEIVDDNDPAHASSDLTNKILELSNLGTNGQVSTSLGSLVGIRIISAVVEQIKVQGSQALADALEADKIAKERAKATLTLETAKAEAGLIADQKKAEGILALGAAEADRVEKMYGAIGNVPNGDKIHLAEAIAKQDKLTHLVLGDKTGINVGI